MAVPCPGCDREYDVTLFQFGRTIHCTCGERVGLEQRLGPSPWTPSTLPTPSDRSTGLPASTSGASTDARKPRFIADAMFGRLARWLRTLGFDTAYDDAISDADLVRRSLEEDRIILTRDRRLPVEWRIENYLLLDTEGIVDGLSHVVSALELDRPERLFTRCRDCNAELEPAAPEDVADEVPARVLERSERFSRCPACHRVFWEGSHTEGMLELVDRVFEERDRSV